MDLDWNKAAFKDYCMWQRINKGVAEKINELIADIKQHPFTGLGKPEPLKHNLQGYWSRRITQEHRLIYKASGTPTPNALYIYSCNDHYEGKE